MSLFLWVSVFFLRASVFDITGTLTCGADAQCDRRMLVR